MEGEPTRRDDLLNWANAQQESAPWAGSVREVRWVDFGARGISVTACPDVTCEEFVLDQLAVSGHRGHGGGGVREQGMSTVPLSRPTYVAGTEIATSVPQRDFFISYNGEDHQWAEWLAWVLEENGYATYIQEWDFRPGQNFVLAMQQASTTANRTLLVLSGSFLRSLFPQPEWAAAFATDPTGQGTRLIPVRVQPCQPDGLLSSIIYIDLVDCEETEAERRLLRGVRAGRAKPPERPAFPGVIRLDPRSASGEAAR